MTWLAENWFWVLLGVAFIAMQFFGHGGRSGSSEPSKRLPDELGAAKRPGPTIAHHH